MSDISDRIIFDHPYARSSSSSTPESELASERATEAISVEYFDGSNSKEKYAEEENEEMNSCSSDILNVTVKSNSKSGKFKSHYRTKKKLKVMGMAGCKYDWKHILLDILREQQVFDKHCPLHHYSDCWGSIASEMQKRGFKHMSKDMCKNLWKQLLKRYKDIIDVRPKSSWKYFMQVRDLVQRHNRLKPSLYCFSCFSSQKREETALSKLKGDMAFSESINVDALKQEVRSSPKTEREISAIYNNTDSVQEGPQICSGKTAAISLKDMHVDSTVQKPEKLEEQRAMLNSGSKWFSVFEHCLFKEKRKDRIKQRHLHLEKIGVCQQKNLLLQSLNTSVKDLCSVLKEDWDNKNFVSQQSMLIDDLHLSIQIPQFTDPACFSEEDPAVNSPHLQQTSLHVNELQHEEEISSNTFCYKYTVDAPFCAAKALPRIIQLIRPENVIKNCNNPQGIADDQPLLNPQLASSSACRHKSIEDVKIEVHDPESVAHFLQATRKSHVRYWTEAAENILVATRLTMHEQFQRSRNHEPLWAELAAKLAAQNVFVSPDQVRSKWFSFKNKWVLARTCVDGTRKFRFMELFDALYAGNAANGSFLVFEISS